MCRNSRICDEIRSQIFEELPDWNTEYMLDEIATNFMRPPPTWDETLDQEVLLICEIWKECL